MTKIPRALKERGVALPCARHFSLTGSLAEKVAGNAQTSRAPRSIADRRQPRRRWRFPRRRAQRACRWRPVRRPARIHPMGAAAPPFGRRRGQAAPAGRCAPSRPHSG
eukprot:scaffold88580_cov26-Tisochrysis_lutea.AAC.2